MLEFDEDDQGQLRDYVESTRHNLSRPNSWKFRPPSKESDGEDWSDIEGLILGRENKGITFCSARGSGQNGDGYVHFDWGQDFSTRIPTEADRGGAGLYGERN